MLDVEQNNHVTAIKNNRTSSRHKYIRGRDYLPVAMPKDILWWKWKCRVEEGVGRPAARGQVASVVCM